MNIRVNGQDISVCAEESLLTGLLENGFDVPNLCYAKELEAYGGCGLCIVEVKGMARPLRACAAKPWEGMEVETDSPRIEQSRKMSLGLLLSNHRGDCLPPCKKACPSSQDCQGYIGLVAEGKFEDAFSRIMEDNPLPACIGRVCPHPCEDACRRGKLEGPISLMHLKRFTAEMASASFTPVLLPDTGKKVAVIGAGPAGLSAAYFLARRGHRVRVFDKMPETGGMLRYGIPEYRLPGEVIDQEVSRLEKMGVQFYMQQTLGEEITLASLQKDVDAVFVAVGAWNAMGLGCENDQLPGVLGGIDFLRDVAMHRGVSIGSRVAVVGGGNTAMDVARTAVRLGATEVYVVYRRTKAEMPAEALEIREAEEEGVQFIFLAAPEAVVEQDGCASGLRLQRMQLGAPDASGRRRPEPTGETQELAVDTIISAIGQRVRKTGLEQLAMHRWQTIIADPETFATNIEGVFAGGDAINDGPGIAISAIAHGKKAAQAIDSYLKGKLEGVVTPFYVQQDIEDIKDLPRVSEVRRVQVSHEDAQARKQHFHEYVQTLTVEQAQREASRCLECGCCDLYDCKLLPLLQRYGAQETEISGYMSKKDADTSHPFIWRDPNKCILCGLCVRACDELVGVNALGFDGRGFETTAEPAFATPLLESDCISCGVCVHLCPTGALQERRAFEKSPPLPARKEEHVCDYCDKRCRFEVSYYGESALQAIPLQAGQSCSIGRYAPVLQNKRATPYTPLQAEALRKVLRGDLRAFAGTLPEKIGSVLLQEGGEA